MSNIYFDYLEVMPMYPDKLFIQWALNDSSLTANYYFDVYFSDNSEQDFVKVTDSSLSNTYYYEYSLDLLNNDESVYIKIKCVVDGQEIWSQPKGLFFNLDADQYLQVREIIRLKDLNRRLNTGVCCAIFKKIIYGVPCPDCLDEYTNYVKNTHCETCYGTGKYGGYRDPIFNYMELVSQNKSMEQTQVGTVSNKMAYYNITYPFLERDDVIVEIDRNRRWIVKESKITVLRTFPIDQNITIGMLSPKDIQYKLEYDESEALQWKLTRNY